MSYGGSAETEGSIPTSCCASNASRLPGPSLVAAPMVVQYGIVFPVGISFYRPILGTSWLMRSRACAGSAFRSTKGGHGISYFEHDHGVATDDHHAYRDLLAACLLLERIIKNDVQVNLCLFSMLRSSRGFGMHTSYPRRTPMTLRLPFSCTKMRFSRYFFKLATRCLYRWDSLTFFNSGCAWGMVRAPVKWKFMRFRVSVAVWLRCWRLGRVVVWRSSRGIHSFSEWSWRTCRICLSTLPTCSMQHSSHQDCITTHNETIRVEARTTQDWKRSRRRIRERRQLVHRSTEAYQSVSPRRNHTHSPF
jgi:hypothetical protein